MMNYKERSRFYFDLAVMLKSGVPISRALDLARQKMKPRNQDIIDRVRHLVHQGSSFWEAMSQFPSSFDAFQVNFIRAAETSGTLVESCQKLARYFEMRRKEKRRMLVGLIYPAFLIHAVILLPPIKYLFFSKLGVNYWGLVMPRLLMVYAAVGIPVLLWQRLESGHGARKKLDRFKLSLPVVGKLVKNFAVARVLWILSNMLESGIDAVTAVRSAADGAGNAVITKRMLSEIHLVESGRSLTEFFTATNLLDPDPLSMIAIGEESGSIPLTLMQSVMRLEESNTSRFRTLLKILVFGVYLTAALIIAITIVTFYAGMFNVN
jgi:type II secretory pathway component PulF